MIKREEGSLEKKESLTLEVQIADSILPLRIFNIIVDVESSFGD